MRVRREFRELCSGWGTLRLIEDAFDAEGFVPGPEPEEWEVSGMRRRLFDSYADVIDWQNREQVDRAMRVFEEVWSWGEGVEAEYRERELAKMLRLLDKDGYTIDDRGRIRPARLPRLAELPLEHLDDPASIEEHLGRLDPDDPPLAISSAKSLIEATCKKVLEALGEEYEERAEVPQLVKSVQMALKAHPETIAPTAKGKDTIVRVLASLSQVAIGVAELRNEYGTDHGRTRPSKGLGPRHAHLAVDAAHTYCRFLLQTLHDRLPEASQRPAP
ncbi:MAG: abortive infection family protein [Acidimicrobiia bacterium]|nr:abortive infection family protein [Acidimicrobiia bacterium]